jgi:hypothetical protein
LPIEPVVEPTKAVLRSKEPEAPYLRTDQGLNRCSRCSSTNHLYQDADQLWFCGICQVHLPYEPVEDMEIKYTDSPYRKLHWMA